MLVYMATELFSLQQGIGPQFKIIIQIEAPFPPKLGSLSRFQDDADEK